MTNAEKLVANKDKLVLKFRECLSLEAQLSANISEIEDCIGETDLHEVISDWVVGIHNAKEIAEIQAEDIFKTLSETMWFPHEKT